MIRPTKDNARCRSAIRVLVAVILGLLAAQSGRSTWAYDGAVQQPAAGNLKVKVAGLKTNRGEVAFALFSSQDSYSARTNPVAAAFVKIRERKCEWTVENLPPGEYAVMLFHDRNGNGKLDTVFRMPAEPYGFSNNARALTRAPYFQESKFVVEGDTVIEVKVK